MTWLSLLDFSTICPTCFSGREFVYRKCLNSQRLLKSINSWNPRLHKPGGRDEVGMIYFNNREARHGSTYLQLSIWEAKAGSQQEINFTYIASSRPASSTWEPILGKGEPMLPLLVSASPTALYFSKFRISSPPLTGHGIPPRPLLGP